MTKDTADSIKFWVSMTIIVAAIIGFAIALSTEIMHRDVGKTLVFGRRGPGTTDHSVYERFRSAEECEEAAAAHQMWNHYRGTTDTFWFCQ